MKTDSTFRNYVNNIPIQDFYRKQHTQLTYNKAFENNYMFINSVKKRYSINELLDICDQIVDPSDPDMNMSQTIHSYQTAIGAMKTGYNDELITLCLIHDLGKCVNKLCDIDMTFLVGDTYPLGCPFEKDSIILSDTFTQNTDNDHSFFQNEYGIYSKNCGFDCMLFTGHDEMIYRSCKESNSKLSEEGLYILRYHSFYPWHSNNGYSKYASEYDFKNKHLLQKFQKLDLYTKSNEPLLETDKEKVLEITKQFFPNGILMPTKVV